MLNDLNLERQLLGLLLKDEESASALLGGGLVKEKYFSDMALRRVFIAFSELYYSNFHLPTKRVLKLEVLKGRKKEDEILYSVLINKLFKIKAEVVKGNLDSVLENLKELSQGRIIQKSVRKIAEEFERKNISEAVEIYSNIRRELEETKFEEEDEGDYVEDFEEREEEVIQKRDHPELIDIVPCKIPIYRGSNPYAANLNYLEDVVNGGWHPKKLILVVGHSSTGKSTFLMETAFQAAWEGKTAVFFTIEMAKREQQYRIDSRISNIPFRKFQNGELSNREIAKWKKQVGRFKSKQGQIRVVGYLQGCTQLMIEMKLRELRKTLGKIDLVCIDYLNDMRPNDSRSKKDWSGIGEISLDLRNMSRYFNNHEGLTVITANQGKKGTRTQKNLSEGSVAFSPFPHQHSDIVFMLKEELDREDQVKYLSMKIDKNRFGNKGEVFYLVPDFEVSKIATQIKWNEEEF